MRSFVVRCLFNFLTEHGQFNCYTVMFISSFSHVRLSLDNKRLLTYLLTYNIRITIACSVRVLGGLRTVEVMHVQENR